MFGGWKWKCKNHDFFECAKPKSVSPHVRSVAERKGTVSKLLEAKKSIQLQLLFIGPLVRFGFEKNPSHFTFQFFCKINFNTIIILADWLAGCLPEHSNNNKAKFTFFTKTKILTVLHPLRNLKILRKLNRKKINKDTKNLCFVSSSASSLPSFLTKWFVFSILLVLLLFLLNQWSVIVD